MPFLIIKLTRFLAVLVCMLSGCASKGDVSPATTDFNDARIREIKQLSTYAIAPDDGYFSTTAISYAIPQITPQEEYYHISIPINTESPVECLVYKKDGDAASALKNILAALLSELPEHQVFKANAGTFDHLPYLYQEMLYRSENTVGTLKGVVVPVPSALVVCVHDEVGYVETFGRVVESLVTSLQIKGQGPIISKYYEVGLLTLRDINVGYMVNRFVASPGVITNIVTTSVMVPRTVQDIIAEDTYEIMVEDAAGRLLKGAYANTENGQLKHTIQLERKDMGTYQVSGQYHGKAINSLLTSTTELTGAYRQTRELTRVAKSSNKNDKTLQLDTYVPSVNPLRSLLMTAKPTGKRVEKLPEYTIQFGTMEATAIVDENGAKQTTMSIGPFEMQVTRVYATGQI